MIINNNIEENYCSFEVSKLLKEKGFGVSTISCYEAGIPAQGEFFEDWNRDNRFKDSKDSASRPTHAVAIEWLRVNYSTDISILIVAGSWYGPYIFRNRNRMNKEGEPGQYFSSPQEATEAALLYTLKNLI